MAFLSSLRTTDRPVLLHVAFKTLGCPKNEADSDAMKARVRAAGYELSDDLESAEILVINTCSFIEEASTESINLILEAADIWLPENENRHIVVTGCMVSRYGEDELNAELPEVSGFIPVVNEHTIVAVIEKLSGVAAQEGELKRRAEAAYAYVKISDGCHRSCAYCTIPSIRGPYVSRPLSEIVSEITDLVESGTKEIILIGQDTSSYGRDFADDYEGPSNIVELMTELIKLDVYRYRLMYLQVEGLQDELLELIARSDKIAKYLELPLQHANKEILRAMRRAGDGSSYLSLIKKMRAMIPGVAIRSTMIVGFPGETDEQFEELCEFLTEAAFDYCGVFSYSQEEGTPAAALPNQIDENTKLERLQILRDLSDSISWNIASAHIDKEYDCLIEGRDEEGAVYGRTYFQAPDIDGIVRIAETDTVLQAADVVRVRVDDSILYDLEASVVDLD